MTFGMYINHNLGSMNALSALGQNGSALQTALQELSTGKRINSAADDAAGLSISQKMQAQINGLGQASRNAQDGISMLQTAEGALGQTQDILQRMRQLAVQASNGTNTQSDTAAIQQEITQLTSEMNRIGNTTQFNMQSLLQGSTAPAVTTGATNTTVTQGQSGVATGSFNPLQTLASSVKGVSSSAVVQADRSAATGSVNNFSLTTNSIQGQKASVTVTNGLTFTASTTGTNMNTYGISIVQGTGNSTASSMALSGSTYTITIGTDANGSSLAVDRGTLYNQVSSAVSAYSTANAGWSTGNTGFSVAVPANTATPLSSVTTTGSFAGGKAEQDGQYSFTLNKAFTEAGDSVTIGGKTFTAVFGSAGAGQFSIGASASSVANIGTQTQNLATAIASDSTLGARFGSTTQAGTTQAAGKVVYDSTGNSIYLQEVAGQATGVDLTAPTVAGSGTDDKLTISNAGGQNLNSVTIVQGSAQAGVKAATGKIDTSFQVTAGNNGTELNGVTVAFGTITSAGAADALTTSWNASTRTLTVSGSLATTTASSTAFGTLIQTGLQNAGFSQAGTITTTAGAAVTSANIATAFTNKSVTFGDTANGGLKGVTAVTADTLAVDETAGNLTVYLANATPSKNSAANIQAQIQALGKVNGNDYTQYTATSSGNWDTQTLGNDLTKATGTFVGGTQAVNGQYSLNISKAFAVGDTVSIKGQTFTAVASNADSTKGQFNVAGGNISSQASSLIDAIDLNSAISANYTATATGSTINLKENQASGTDLKTTDVGVAATGVQGQYSVAANQLLTDGGSFTIDGQNITVSSKPTNVGYANGTAIQQASTVSQQTQSLATAINANSNLNQKYTASVDASGNLLLNQKVGNSTAPSVSMTTSTKGDFQASFQIGANTGQNMTIDVKDMRSEALSVAGDGTASTVAASNGQVASYVSTANVTNGTDNSNSQYSLDVSTSSKASGAISVIDDAINSVSQQRSALGAYQNRLQFTINNLGTANQNLTDASSRITDVDMAQEMAQFTKDNVLQQAAVSMLAQANQQPQMVLKLLG